MKALSFAPNLVSYKYIINVMYLDRALFLLYSMFVVVGGYFRFVFLYLKTTDALVSPERFLSVRNLL